MDTKKECTSCHEVKSLHSFGKESKSKDGHKARCKSCVSIDGKKRRQRRTDANKKLSLEEIRARTPEARCSECRQIRPSYQFGRRNASKNGLQSTCTSCVPVVARKYQEDYSSLNIGLSSEFIRERTPYATCWSCGRDLPSTAFGRSSCRKNGLNDRCLSCNSDRGLKWKKENPEKSRANSAAYRARKKGLFLEDFTYSQIVERDGAEACAYCHTTEGPFDVDHIFPLKLNGWHTPNNLVLACASHNRSKGAVHPAIYIKREGHSPNQTVLRALTLEHELTHSSTEEEAATCA